MRQKVAGMRLRSTHSGHYSLYVRLTVPAFTLFAISLGFDSACGAESKPPSDPRILSVHPSALRAGETTQVVIRGTDLAGSRALFFPNEVMRGRVLEVKSEPAKESAAVFLVRAELTAAPASEGTHSFRLAATQGLSNALRIHVVTGEVVDESLLQTAIDRFPIVVSGEIRTKGEVDTIWIEAKAGETLTFHCVPGVPSFDPSLVLAKPSGSWFDDSRLNRIAFNDEPLHFPGLSTDARLVHRFEAGGRHAIQVRGFSGQGGPDSTYHLRISPGEHDSPRLHPQPPSGWEERQFTRKLPSNWMSLLSERGGRAAVPESVPVFQATVTEVGEMPVMTAPGMIEGRFSKPAETHRIRLRVESPQDLAIEVETPEATMPRFNPVVRLLAPGGAEVVTNVYTKRNNNGLYMMKMIQAKSTFTLRSAGDYLLEVRDITTDVVADDFVYRVLVRPQIPHIGKVEINEDRINLEPGQAKPLTVNLEREEGFTGLVLVAAEGLPGGVAATAGMANPVEKPPLPNGGRLERYVGKPQTATLLLSAAEDVKPTDAPVAVRVLLRTISNGNPSPPILVKEVPLMVIPRRPS
jgi:hypothetical protein